VNRILIVRLSALGDVVHTIPVAAALRKAFPTARIDWLVGANYREILDLVPIIDRRLVVGSFPSTSGSSAGGREAGERRRPTSIFGAIGELRRTRYDVAIDLQGLFKSAVLARSSGASRVVGFASSYLREQLARPFYTDVYDPGCNGIYDPRETRHVVEINLGILQPLGITAGPPEFPIEAVESEVARAMRDRTGGRYALLNPGAAWPNKRWPPDRLGRVASALRDRYGLTSIALWGEGERDLADQVVAHSQDAAVLPPRASIKDLVALARGAAVIVSGDTGPAHIAAAVGTPVVGIFGPTRPSRNGPWAPADVTVSRYDECECHHLRRCRRRTMCLLDIQVEEVLEAIARRLATQTAHV
jgi:lipopolysaccharide heptosyltransferase I